MPEQQPLDSYSQIVAGVAAELTGKVASLRVPQPGRGSASRGGGGRGGESLGSGVVFTGDGFMLTNAHVVGGAAAGTAAFADGSTTPFRVVGADPLSDLAVLRTSGTTPPPAELGEADDLVVGQLVVAVGNPLGLAGLGHRRGGQRPGPVPAHPQRRRRPADRGRDPDRRRPQPG